LPPLRRTANAHGRETGGVVLDVEGRSEKEGGGEREQDQDQDQEQECLMARRVQSFLLLSLYLRLASAMLCIGACFTRLQLGT
jgi:hypothetical protein